MEIALEIIKEYGHLGLYAFLFVIYIRLGHIDDRIDKHEALCEKERDKAREDRHGLHDKINDLARDVGVLSGKMEK